MNNVSKSTYHRGVGEFGNSSRVRGTAPRRLRIVRGNIVEAIIP